MAIIDHLIPISSLEQIPLKIYSILKKEFDWQIYKYNNTICMGVNFMSERTVPVDKVETDMVTIMTATGNYDNQSVGSHHADPYTFIIDIITKSKTTSSKRGDLSAAQKLIKLSMIIRYILMSPQYLTLELTGIIEGTSISKMQIYKDERTPDTSDIATGQLIFNVKCDETSKANIGILLEQADTDVRIELTQQGFAYVSTSTIPEPDIYYDFEIVSSAITINNSIPPNQPIEPMDGVNIISYDYLNTGVRGILSVNGWPGVSIKSIFYSTDNGRTANQLTDFPGPASHADPGLIECSDGSLLKIGGDKNDLPYGSNQIWRYIKNSTPGLEGTWTMLTANMGKVWADRIMCKCWHGGDGYIYAAFGQSDNSGSEIFYTVIRIPELTTTGRNWQYVADFTDFFNDNNITALSDYSLSFDGTNAILTGGLFYTGSFSTNVYNDKVIKISNRGTSISITGTLNSGGYPNANCYDGKHWVQFGAVINEAHTNAQNTKGLAFSSDLGATWTMNYNAPGGRHAGSLINHFDTDDKVVKIFSLFGNLWNSSYSITATEFPSVKPIDEILLPWLFCAKDDKPDNFRMTGINSYVQELIDGGLWSRLEYVKLTPGMNTDNQRLMLWKGPTNTENQDAENYKTPYRSSGTPTWITDISNPYYVAMKGTSSFNIGWKQSRDKVNVTTSNVYISNYCIGAIDGGADCGFLSGNTGNLIIGTNWFDQFYIAVYSDIRAMNPSPISNSGYRGGFRIDSDDIYGVEETILRGPVAQALDTSEENSDIKWGRAGIGEATQRLQVMNNVWAPHIGATTPDMIALAALERTAMRNLLTYFGMPLS